MGFFCLCPWIVYFCTETRPCLKYNFCAMMKTKLGLGQWSTSLLNVYKIWYHI